MTRLNGKETTIYHSFHPATAVCYNKCQPALRFLLAYHYTAAFLELRHPQEPPDWAINISKSAANTSWNEELTPESAEKSLHFALLIILGVEKSCYVRFRTNPTVSRVWRDDISTLVGYLSATSYQDEALLVGRATLLWQNYFSTLPQSQKVHSQLLDLGHRQTIFSPISPNSSTTELGSLRASLLLLKFKQPAKSPVCPSDQAKKVLGEIQSRFYGGDL